MQTQNIIPKSTRFQRFFWWCAGANPYVLAVSPKKWTQTTAVGILCFFVALIAAIAMTFVLTGLPGIGGHHALFGGIFWGFGVVLVLERLLFAGYRKVRREGVSVLRRYLEGAIRDH